MKQMTEAELRTALTKAYEQGADHTLEEERGARMLDHVEYDKRREEFIETIIQSL